MFWQFPLLGWAIPGSLWPTMLLAKQEGKQPACAEESPHGHHPALPLSPLSSQLPRKANIWQKAEHSIEGMPFLFFFFFFHGTVCGSPSVCLQQVLQKVKANLCISAPLCTFALMETRLKQAKL